MIEREGDRNATLGERGLSSPQIASEITEIDPSSFAAGRYRLVGKLGRGGMAQVYRVEDATTGEILALKRLVLPAGEKQQRRVVALFEREFHTLAQLAHPCVVEVYDCGIDGSASYYTMELLDNGDLHDRSPMPWRHACQVSFDICSALALVHSRRLVHRDISPRNVRCTSSGRAKLIDFGAIAPVGPCNVAVGTPAFISPEALHASTLDARTDLYSLGATLYYALTGRAPYPTRDIKGVMHAWRSRPTQPSALVADLPAELNALVMALLSLDPNLRPPSAFEVMQRLASIACLDREEPLSVSRAYLVTPSLVGSDDALSAFRAHLTFAFEGRGSSLLIEGAPGLGRSRLLDVCVLEAKIAGAAALRAGPHDAGTSRFSLARALAQHVLETMPDLALSAAHDEGIVDILFESQPLADVETPVRPVLRSSTLAAAEELTLQTALAKWFLALAARQPLLIAVDDIDRVDAASIALLAAIAHRVRHRPLLLCLSTSAASTGDSTGLQVLAAQSSRLELRPLEPAETEALLTSLFGDAANMSLLSERIHAIAGGRPRECMALAQHLIDRGVITYASGSWTLPEHLLETDMPSTVNELFRQRACTLSAAARRLAEAQALGVCEAFTREDYLLLAPELSVKALDQLIDELVLREIVIGDGSHYTLGHQGVRHALIAGMDASERRGHHQKLAALPAEKGHSQLTVVHHLLAAGATQQALNLLSEVLNASSDSAALSNTAQMRYEEIALVLEQALDAAERETWQPRACSELRRWLLLLSVVSDTKYYERVAAALLNQLEHDSGLRFFREDDARRDPMQRLTHALQAANERHAATAEDARVYRVDEAIKHLAYYVVASIAVGARSLDVRLLETLPALIEPFAPLSPVLDAIWQNALATCDGVCRARPELALERWSELYERLGQVSGQDLQYVTMIRSSVAFGIGALQVQLGLQSAGDWATILDADPVQRVSAMYLRKTVCMLHGDFAGAERFRRQAEVLALQASSPQMFTNLLGMEIGVHGAAHDLTGVKRVRDRIAPLAARYPGWRAYLHLADAWFHKLRGDLAAACTALEQALALTEPDVSDPQRIIVVWPRVASLYIEALIERGQVPEALDFGLRTLERCRQLGIEAAAFDTQRATALAEAKQQEHEAAAARLEQLISAQLALGVSGLNLGLSYEARARIAIWAGDRAAVEHYGPLVAHEYGHGDASPLGARYERLMLEARATGIRSSLPPPNVEPSGLGADWLSAERATNDTLVADALGGDLGRDALPRRALEYLCSAYNAGAGHLFLIRGGILVHAATLGTQESGANLLPRARAFWESHLDAADLPTAFVPDTGALQPATGADWTGTTGAAYRPLLLHCMLDTGAKHVGVLVLVTDSATTHAPANPEIGKAVAAYLLRHEAALPR